MDEAAWRARRPCGVNGNAGCLTRVKSKELIRVLMGFGKLRIGENGRCEKLERKQRRKVERKVTWLERTPLGSERKEIGK